MINLNFIKFDIYVVIGKCLIMFVVICVCGFVIFMKFKFRLCIFYENIVFRLRCIKSIKYILMFKI